jgi:hypothetical protein
VIHRWSGSGYGRCFGPPGPEPYAHPGAGNAGHIDPPAHADNPAPAFHPSEANYSSPDGRQLHIDAAGHHGDSSPPVFDPGQANYSSPDGQQLHIDAAGVTYGWSSHDGPGFHVTDVATSHDASHDGPGFDVTGVDGGGGALS